MHMLLFFLSIYSLQADNTVYNEHCPRTEDAYRIMTFNLRKFGKEDKEERLWPARAAHVRNLIENVEPDFFGVQEAYRTQLDSIMKNDPIKSKYSWIGRGRKEGAPDKKVDLGLFSVKVPLSELQIEGEHSSIFYRKDKFKKLDHGTFWLNKNKKEGKSGWGEPYNRICSWIKLEDKKTKQIIWIFNTHLAVKSKEAREKGLNLILQEMAKKVKNNEIAFLTGDFNDKSVAPDSSLGKVISSSKFRVYDTAELAAKKIGPSYTALTHDWKPGNKKIDFIMVHNRDQVEILSQCILSPKKGILISDHLPIVIDFKIKSN